MRANLLPPLPIKHLFPPVDDQADHPPTEPSAAVEGGFAALLKGEALSFERMSRVCRPRYSHAHELKRMMLYARCGGLLDDPDHF